MTLGRFGRGPVLETLSTLCGIAIAAAPIPLALLGQRHAALAKARAWTVAAPPCPTLARLADIGFSIPRLTVLDYAGVGFGRAYGSMSCSKITHDRTFGLGLAPVCQFNNPTVLQVISPRGQFIFKTGMDAATVTVVDGLPRCRLNAKLGFDWLRQ